MGIIPACGVFCGGCPNYIRSKRSCPGASQSTRCHSCTSYHLCCVNQGITHCFQCPTFPCQKFKRFAKVWLKYGQDFLDNQKLLAEVGEEEFVRIWNAKVFVDPTDPAVQ